jgi:hypothetical protein
LQLHCCSSGCRGRAKQLPWLQGSRQQSRP